MTKAKAKAPLVRNEPGSGEGPEPLRQGDLDGLCGVYGVINAVRLAAHPHRRLGATASGELFAVLTAELAATGRLHATMTDGTAKVGRLVRRARRWLRDAHGLELEITRPFRQRGGLDPDDCRQRLTEHLARVGTAAIVAMPEHWTVARAVSGRRLVLLDSQGRYHCRLSTAFADSGAGRLDLPSTVLLRVSPPQQRS